MQKHEPRFSMTARGILKRFSNRLTTPRVVLSLIILAVLAVFVVMPFARLVRDTLVWQGTDIRISRDAQPGTFTTFHWERTFASPLTKNLLILPLIHSLEVGVSVAVLALVIGGLLAWLIVRTDMPFKKLIGALAVIPYVLPSYTLALAWIIVFKNERIGGAMGLFQYLTGISPPNWLSYGYVPIVINLAIHYSPFAYLLISGALASIDSRLEESAELLGATRWLTLRRITLPIVLPAILSAFILVFSRSIGIFGTPYFLGSPVRYFTLPTMIYTNIVSRTPSAGYILALVLILSSTFLIFINQKFIGTRRSFVTISGKGFRSNLTRLGPWKTPAILYAAGIILMGALLPLLLLLWQTLMRYPGNYSFANLTSLFWVGPRGTEFAEGEAGILRNWQIIGAAWNSVKLSVTVAFVTGILGLLAGYAVVKGRGTFLSKALEQLTFLPYLIPSIAFGAIYLSVFTHDWGPIPSLYGTFLLLVLVCTFKNLPFASRSGTSAMLQVGGELEEAASVAGAGWFRRFGRIILPLTLKGAMAGFILVFITTMRELSLIILLVTPKTRMLTTMTFRYLEQGYAQFANAITLLIAFLVLIGVWISRRMGGKGLV